jgi:rhodanese-related sulfurtransferase
MGTMTTMHTLRRHGSLHPDELAAALADYVVIDVRDRVSWNAGHIPGSIHVEIEQLRGGWSDTDSRLPVAVLANAGSAADEAVRLLVEHGLDAVAIDGGADAWRAARHCLVINRD